MDMEQSIIHEVEGGVLTAAEGLAKLNAELEPYGGVVSQGALDKLIELGLVTPEVAADNPVEEGTMEIKIDPAVEEMTAPSPEGAVDDSVIPPLEEMVMSELEPVSPEPATEEPVGSAPTEGEPLGAIPVEPETIPEGSVPMEPVVEAIEPEAEAVI